MRVEAEMVNPVFMPVRVTIVLQTEEELAALRGLCESRGRVISLLLHDCPRFNEEELKELLLNIHSELELMGVA